MTRARARFHTLGLVANAASCLGRGSLGLAPSRSLPTRDRTATDFGVTERRSTGARSASGAAPRIARVLVVDDEPHIGRSLCLALGDEFDVTSTVDPDEALRWLTSGDWYDVVLCDLMMPTMSGVDLRARVLEHSPDLAARIIFVTGGLLLPHVQALLESVPNTVLAKPFDLDAMRALIRRRTARDAVTRKASR